MTEAIVLWNVVYLERAAAALRGHGQAVDDDLLQYLSKIGGGKFKPRRSLAGA